jgi:hypothetical protein
MSKAEPKTNHQCDELNYFIPECLRVNMLFLPLLQFIPEGLRVAMLFLQRKIAVVDNLGE